jgi:membrane-bound lytic murein transglycosylase B
LLKAIGKAESGFNPNAVSAAGALGVMQLMPSTAEGLGVDNPLDPVQNIMGGARMVANLLERYDGDVTLTLAAYNAGPGNVAKYGGVPPFAETQAYIPRVLSYFEGGNVHAGTVTGVRAAGSYGKSGASISGGAALSGFNAQMFALNLLAKLEQKETETPGS